MIPKNPHNNTPITSKERYWLEWVDLFFWGGAFIGGNGVYLGAIYFLPKLQVKKSKLCGLLVPWIAQAKLAAEFTHFFSS